jgi:hypothetical protein
MYTKPLLTKKLVAEVTVVNSLGRPKRRGKG